MADGCLGDGLAEIWFEGVADWRGREDEQETERIRNLSLCRSDYEEENLSMIQNAPPAD